MEFVDKVVAVFEWLPKKALITGVYRFDFAIDDVNNEYNFKILDEKKEEIVNTYSSNEGKTVELKKGQKYEIQMVQSAGLVKFAVKIHIPNKASNIRKNIIKGSIYKLYCSTVHIVLTSTRR